MGRITNQFTRFATRWRRWKRSKYDVALQSNRALQRPDLCFRERPELAWSQMAESDGADAHADQFFNEIAERFEHAAHLAFASFVQLNLDPGVLS